MKNKNISLSRDDIINQIKKNNAKITEQRIKVIECILNIGNNHFTTKQLHDKALEEDSTIGVATVYRTVNLLYDINILQKMDYDGLSRYELNFGDNHHHLVCQNCNTIVEVPEDLIKQFDKEIEKKYNFNTISYDIKLFGICSNCQD